MIDALVTLAATHPGIMVAGTTGAIIVATAAAIRAYGRRHERATRRRGNQLIG